MLGLQNEREWAAFCSGVLEAPELATDPRFDANAKRHLNRAELKAIILATFARLSAEAVVERLERAQIANAQMNSMADVWKHPQLAARQRFVEVDSTVGAIPALLPPGANDQFDYRMDPIPQLGAHTDAILAELGESPEAIAQLRHAKAI
jgi:crotonobetainyl-CoA:carnitine CoA-transferase CaiB-like acyl-CoA transferase